MDLLRDFSEVETGMGADVVRLLTAGGYTSDVYRLREGEGTVKLKYALTGNGVTANFLGLDVKQGAALTVIMDFASEPAAGEKAENSETEKNAADTSAEVDIIKENTPAAAAGAGPCRFFWRRGCGHNSNRCRRVQFHNSTSVPV